MKNRFQRRNQIKVKGFQPGHVPFHATPLEDVVVIGGYAYQVKSRGADGRITELYGRSWMRNQKILVRLYLFLALRKVEKGLSWLFQNLARH